MLDRSKSHQFHYYQPGIGTYVTSKSFSHTGRFQRIKSAYLKAKDSAIGSSFAEHVMGGYKFLMRYYSPGDEIYFIGFSRGSYIARFLSEMLDYIGLLEAGNEELTRFAWKTFAKWQQRRGDTEEDRTEKKKLFEFMKAFRETFSRPVSRIKFMGLFDTVNSVPRFESAWMQRSKFPYTARSSAKTIRHAVGIDERRAKFRQDLISGAKPTVQRKSRSRDAWRHMQNHLHLDELMRKRKLDEKAAAAAAAGNEVPSIVVQDNEGGPAGQGGNARSQNKATRPASRNSHGDSSFDMMAANNRYRAPSHHARKNLAVPNGAAATPAGAASSADDLASVKSGQTGGLSLQVPGGAEDDDDNDEQDIQEVWFPGCHADIGGGWKLEEGESWPLSHNPLVWMVQEAWKAGLQLDPRKVKQFECLEEFEGEFSPIREECAWGAHDDGTNPELAGSSEKKDGEDQPASASSRNFHNAMHLSSTKGWIHDCLSFGNGLPAGSVIVWRIMEYLPFRRMDLQPDGSWKPIRWPLPCGEVRDIPVDASIHVSALRRMQTNPKYRPGNLIVGGGGRGVRFAPPEYGIGEWAVKDYHGHPVKEVYIRKSATEQENTEEK